MAPLKKIGNHFIITVIIGLTILGCINQDQKQALQSNIISPPQNQRIVEGEMVYFEGATSGGYPPYTYNWEFGPDISPSVKKTPGKIFFNYEGAYSVIFTVKDSKGHVNTDRVNIIVQRREMF